jgi:hypothetical protein
MAETSNETRFIVWGVDQTPYGPVELPTLLAWVQDERVTAQSWVFLEQTGIWKRASELPELQNLFPPAVSPAASGEAALSGLQPNTLRRIRVLSGLSQEQMERFARFIEVERVVSQSLVVRQGERDDALYFICEGTMRVRSEVLGREIVLTRLTSGDCFGDLAFLDHGPRAADVVADTDALLVKISGTSFDELARTSFDLAAPLLRALDQTLTTRIRADNERFGDAVRHAAHAA